MRRRRHILGLLSDVSGNAMMDDAQGRPLSKGKRSRRDPRLGRGRLRRIPSTDSLTHGKHAGGMGGTIQFRKADVLATPLATKNRYTPPPASPQPSSYREECPRLLVRLS